MCDFANPYLDWRMVHELDLEPRGLECLSVVLSILAVVEEVYHDAPPDGVDTTL